MQSELCKHYSWMSPLSQLWAHEGRREECVVWPMYAGDCQSIMDPKDAPMLFRVVKEASVKWTVHIIKACYTGGAQKALSDSPG